MENEHFNINFCPSPNPCWAGTPPPVRVLPWDPGVVPRTGPGPPRPQGAPSPPGTLGGRFFTSNYAQLRSANGAGFGLSQAGSGVRAEQYPVDIAPEEQFRAQGRMGPAGTSPGHKNLKEGAWPLLLSPLAPLWAGAPGGTLLRGEVEGYGGGG